MKLLDYITGFRKGKDAHRLEKESMKDPFLADALDGYTQVKGNHEEQIRELRRQITTRSVSRKNRHFLSWSIAACLMLGFGISYYFIYLKNNKIDEHWVAKEATSQIVQSPESTPTATLAPKVDKDTSAHLVVKNKSKKKDLVARTHSTAISKTDSTVSVSIMKEEAETLTATRNLADNRLAIKTNDIIRGKVVDEDGKALVGANIFVNDSDTGTISDLNGEFSLKDIGNKKITASYIGYNSVTLPVDSTNYVLIAMNEDKNKVLNEVVVTGMATQKKATVIGAISTVNNDRLHEPTEPQPVIGKKEYKRYLKKNLTRPTDACKNIKGEVRVTFLVDSKGRPYSITVTKGLCESADKEAIRLIREGPDWTSGNQSVEVKVKF